MNNFEEALNLVDDMICNNDASLDRALISECVGESDDVMDCFYRVLMSSPANLQRAQISLQAAMIGYLKTDIKADEILASQQSEDRLYFGMKFPNLRTA